MAELSFPSAGGGSVTDERYEALIGSVVPSGLIGSYGTADLVYADSSGMQVKVRPSRGAIVRGFRWESDGAGVVRAIDPNTSGQPRIDLAVLRLNRADWTVTFQVIKGTPAASPLPPSPTQSEATTGKWELPLAQIAVANNATSVASSNVTSRAQYIGGFNYEGDRSIPPQPPQNPAFFYAGDASRHYSNMGGTAWQIFAENGPLTAITLSSGWTGGVYARRWNGFVFLQGYVVRSGPNLASNTASNLCTLPGPFRPTSDMYLVGYAGGTAMRLRLDADNGILQLNGYTIPFNNGAPLAVHPLCYPANNNVS